MARMGMLGTALAGAVKGGADAAVKVSEAQNEFNLRKALQDSEYDMRARLEQAGIQAKQKFADEERGKIRGILDTVKDQDEDKGGYETDDMKATSQRSKLERQKQALQDAGYMDEASKLDNQLARLDKSDAAATLAEIRRQQVDNAFTQGQEKLRLQGEANTAKAEAAAARAENAGKSKETDADKEYNAYVNDVKSNGRKDANGKVSYIPMSRDKWAVWNRNQDARLKQKPGTESVKRIEEDGREITTTRPLGSKATPRNNDPLGLFK